MIIKKPVVFLTSVDLYNFSGPSHTRILCYARSIASKGVPVVLTSLLNNFEKDEKMLTFEDEIFILGSERKGKSDSNKTLPVIKEFNFISVQKYLINLNSRFPLPQDATYLLFPNNFALTIITIFYLRIFKRNLVFIEKNELHTGVALNLQSPSGVKMILYYVGFLLQVVLSVLNDFFEIFFDGMICISSRMFKLYRRFYKDIILIPILADTSSQEYQITGKSKTAFFKIGYTGTITEKRDGIFTLLKAIYLLSKDNYQIECNLYGSITKSNHIKINYLIKKYQLNGKVRYYGNYNADLIKRIQSNQDLLILPRPANLQTNYGFSTKLAEYLSSAVPVLSTDHSDVSDFIKDGVNGFLLYNFNPVQLKNKIVEILNKRNILSGIGEKGRETAIAYFDFTVYSTKLFQFVTKQVD
jgi:glycosyltransferase involved in cell wall biosynthesis